MKKELTKTFIKEKYSRVPMKNYDINKTKVTFIDDTWFSEVLDLVNYDPSNRRVLKN